VASDALAFGKKDRLFEPIFKEKFAEGGLNP
jgi:hypothetical protein